MDYLSVFAQPVSEVLLTVAFIWAIAAAFSLVAGVFNRRRTSFDIVNLEALVATMLAVLAIATKYVAS